MVYCNVLLYKFQVRYDPIQLSALIGDVSTEIPDDVVRAALILMEANCEHQGPTVGFYSPAQLEFLATNRNTNPSTVPIDRSSINIHHITGHWMNDIVMRK